LFSVDQNTRVFFLTEEILVAYHTKREGNDWHTAPRTVEAFFIRVSDGTLIATVRWPATLRKAMDDLVDSEARMLPLKEGRFLVFANGTIKLYSPARELLKERRMESASIDFWSAQGVVGGEWIFMRHASTSSGVTYSWLTPDTLETKYQVPRYEGRNYWIGGVVANQDSAFERSRAGILMIDREQRVKSVCDEPLCRESGSFYVLSSHYLGWSGMTGIGIVDVERGGLVWSKSVEPQYRRNAFEFGEVNSAVSGTKFAMWVVANSKAFFDGVEIKQVTILVYDLANLKDRPLAFHLKPIRGDWTLALSPNGTKLAFFDGVRVQIHPIE
jgi:hypothetical protein